MTTPTTDWKPTKEMLEAGAKAIYEDNATCKWEELKEPSRVNGRRLASAALIAVQPLIAKEAAKEALEKAADMIERAAIPVVDTPAIIAAAIRALIHEQKRVPRYPAIGITEEDLKDASS